MIKATVVAGIALIGAAAGPAIDDRTHISLGTTIAVASFVVPGVFWLGRTLTKICDRLEAMDTRISRLPCEVRKSKGFHEICVDSDARKAHKKA